MQFTQLLLPSLYFPRGQARTQLEEYRMYPLTQEAQVVRVPEQVRQGEVHF
jgi:hypothetical protein